MGRDSVFSSQAGISFVFIVKNFSKINVFTAISRMLFDILLDDDDHML